MLEEIVSRTSPEFSVIRNEIIYALHEMGQKTLLTIIEKSALKPSELFKNLNYQDIINLNYKSTNNPSA